MVYFGVFVAEIWKWRIFQEIIFIREENKAKAVCAHFVSQVTVS